MHSLRFCVWVRLRVRKARNRFYTHRKETEPSSKRTTSRFPFTWMGYLSLYPIFLSLSHYHHLSVHLYFSTTDLTPPPLICMLKREKALKFSFWLIIKYICCSPRQQLTARLKMLCLSLHNTFVYTYTFLFFIWHRLMARRRLKFMISVSYVLFFIICVYVCELLIVIKHKCVTLHSGGNIIMKSENYSI